MKIRCDGNYGDDFKSYVGQVYMKYLISVILFKSDESAVVKDLHTRRLYSNGRIDLRKGVGARLLSDGESAAIDYLLSDADMNRRYSFERSRMFTNYGSDSVKFTSNYDNPYKPSQSIDPRRVHSSCNLELDQLERTIGYNLTRKDLLIEAVSHMSLGQGNYHYRRLAHAGDAVIEIMILKHVVENTSIRNGGTLNQVVSGLTTNKSFSRIVMKFKLYRFVRHNGELMSLFSQIDSNQYNSGDKQSNKMLGDVLEAIIFAVYLDKGCDLESAWSVIKPLFDELLNSNLRSYSYRG